VVDPQRAVKAPSRVYTLEQLRANPNPLAAHYRRFRVGDRLLLTGHSHQAWPDVAREGLLQSFDDAAELVDDKWARAFEQAEAVRAGFRRLLDDPRGHIALGASTHDCLIRFLSALPLQQRPRLLTTDGEFHSLRRQLARLSEVGVPITRVPALPAATLVERLIQQLRLAADRVAAVLVSTVLFSRAHVVPDLTALQEACDAAGASLFLDAYHHLNVVPFSVDRWRLDNAFITGGGYKYCQLGEGNCFLRFPAHTTLRPVVTGWFAEFGLLPTAIAAGPVPYPDGPHRFGGATYDPSSHYRAAAVFDFFARQGLDVGLLRQVSQHQVGRLAAGFDALGLDPAVIRRDLTVPPPDLAGFLALQAPRAPELLAGLRARGVAADARADILRLGPAPYLRDDQLDAAIQALADAVRAVE
jgi:kynureninase